jgi:hypothetical protein
MSHFQVTSSLQAGKFLLSLLFLKAWFKAAVRSECNGRLQFFNATFVSEWRLAEHASLQRKVAANRIDRRTSIY